MLSHTTMGWVALWILWGNTFLVALAAGKRAFELLRDARRFSTAVRGKVDTAVLATHEIEQNGRLIAGTRDIVFHDRSARGTSRGGEILLDDGRRVIVDEGPADVWLDAREVHEAASATQTPEAFEDAYASARRVKGFARTVVAPIARGRDVWVYGEQRSDGAITKIVPHEGRLVISTIDPAAWCRSKALGILGAFIPVIFAGAAGCTMLALHEPVFESLTSKVGGLLGLVFFLIVLPAGTAVRDAVLDPSKRFLRGRWSAPPAARVVAS